MNQRPEPPPEGDLIATALKRSGLSVREGARRAGISEGWWRQIVKGYQSLSGGGYGPVRGPAETVGRMAFVAGVPHHRLVEVGRPDAAIELNRLIREADAEHALDDSTDLLVEAKMERQYEEPWKEAIWRITELTEIERRVAIVSIEAFRQGQIQSESRRDCTG